MLAEKGNYKYLEILRERDERKSEKRLPPNNRKASQNQELQQQSDQRNKYLGSSLSKIL